MADRSEEVKAFIRLRGSLNPEDAKYFRIKGTVFADVPGTPLQHWFDFNGFSISKTECDGAGGYKLLTKEVVLYTDPKDGHIINAWTNKITGKVNEVFHIMNDPVNIPLKSFMIPKPISVGKHGSVVFPVEIMLRRPNELPPDQYGAFSCGPLFQALEIYDLFSAHGQAFRDVSTSPLDGLWYRCCPWLPWMEMGDRDGRLLYNGVFYRMENGLDDVPKDLTQFTRRKFPDFFGPIKPFETPNETSSIYFKKIIDMRKQRSEDVIQIPLEVKESASDLGFDIRADDKTEYVKSVTGSGKSYHSSCVGNVFGFGTESRRPLFSVQGDFQLSVKASGDVMKVSMKANLLPVGGPDKSPLRNWTNPLTSRTADVVPLQFEEKTTTGLDDVMVTRLADMRCVAFVMKSSTSYQSSHVINLMLPNDVTRSSDTCLSGTLTQMWSDWMDMTDIDGFLVIHIVGEKQVQTDP